MSRRATINQMASRAPRAKRAPMKTLATIVGGIPDAAPPSIYLLRISHHSGRCSFSSGSATFQVADALKGHPVLVLRVSLIAIAVSIAVMLCAEPALAQPRDSRSEESLRAFARMTEVLRHPRCLNCHPSGEFPRQGDDQHRHQMLVMRGPDDRGGPAMRCSIEAVRPCAVPPVTQPSTPRKVACPARPTGTWRRSRWHGKDSGTGSSVAH